MKNKKWNSQEKIQMKETFRGLEKSEKKKRKTSLSHQFMYIFRSEVNYKKSRVIKMDTCLKKQ